jgi:drug/metabolite transporter (DMT)-like permease
MALPEPRHYALIAATLVFSVTGYYAIVQAMRVADASAVQPFRYTRLVFSILAGVLVFGEQPDALTLTGAALVIATGIYTFLRERQIGRAARLA